MLNNYINFIISSLIVNLDLVLIFFNLENVRSHVTCV